MSKFHHLDAARGPLLALPPTAALLAFERAAAQQSFRRAARDLALTPSAISHQIRGLEERFGVRLFSRGGRAVRLTPDGERYLQSVSAALSLLGDAGHDLLRRRRQDDELRVSALPLFTSTVLLPALADFRRRHPGLTLHIEATHQYADFDAAAVDVAIRYGRDRSAGLRLEPLVETRLVPLCAPVLARRLRKPADLAGQTLINIAPQPRSWSVWLEEAGIADPDGRRDLWVDSVPAALDAAEQGLGVALGLFPLVRGRRGFGRTLVMPFDPPTRRRETFYFVCRAEQAKEKRVVAFRRWLLEAVARLQDG